MGVVRGNDPNTGGVCTMKLDLSAGIETELTPAQIEAALLEAERPKGTVCGTISAAALTSQSEPKRLHIPVIR